MIIGLLILLAAYLFLFDKNIIGDTISSTIKTYTTSTPQRDLAGVIIGAVNQFEYFISLRAAQYSIDPKIIKAVIYKESAGNPLLVGTSGELGLMQIMPEAAAEMGYPDHNLMVFPEQNIDAGSHYLATQFVAFGGDYQKALQAYNAGAGALRSNPNVSLSYAQDVLNISRGF